MNSPKLLYKHKGTLSTGATTARASFVQVSSVGLDIDDDIQRMSSDFSRGHGRSPQSQCGSPCQDSITDLELKRVLWLRESRFVCGEQLQTCCSTALDKYLTYSHIRLLQLQEQPVRFATENHGRRG